MSKYTKFLALTGMSRGKLYQGAIAAANVVYIYDFIDRWGVNAEQVMSALNAMTGDILVRINSPGGDVQEAIAIANALERYKQKGKVTVTIDALCASAATLIACKADAVSMADNAQYMIHMPWTCCMGSAAEMRKQADIMDMIFTSAMLPAYAAKSGLPPETVAQLCADETWYSAAEALAAGFVDSIENMPDAGESLPAAARAVIVSKLTACGVLLNTPKEEVSAQEPDAAPLALRAPLRLRD